MLTTKEHTLHESKLTKNDEDYEPDSDNILLLWIVAYKSLESISIYPKATI